MNRLEETQVKQLQKDKEQCREAMAFSIEHLKNSDIRQITLVVDSKKEIPMKFVNVKEND